MSQVEPPVVPFVIALLPSGPTFSSTSETTILEAAALAGLRLPSSCRNGTCRACLCRLIEGRVRYRVDWPGLSAEEKADGWILPCVALPESDLKVDQPHFLLVSDAEETRRKRGRGF